MAEIMTAREAVQVAEDSRAIAVQRQEEEQLTREREAGMEREALAVLLQKQADPRESYGTLIFDRLGIAVGGLHDEDIENKSLSVFARGHWRNIADLPFADLRV